MSDTTNEIALPSAALICHDLMDRYGEASHHEDIAQHANFEVADIDGREYKVLLTQKGIGSAATYKAYVVDPLDSMYQSIYTMQAGAPVTERIKSGGQDIAAPYLWPSYVGSSLLYDCYGNQRH